MKFVAKVRLLSIGLKNIESTDSFGTKIIAVAWFKRLCRTRKSGGE